MTFYVASCPIDRCAWRSEPLANDAQAIESVRNHVNGHKHSDLVDHAIKGLGVVRYQRQGGQE